MKGSQYKIISDVSVFAELLHELLNGGELYFATEWNTNEYDEIDVSSVEESFICWHGAKVVECFDAACLLVGQIGGENWLAYNVTAPMKHESLVEIAKRIFGALEVIAICVSCSSL